MTKEQKIKEEYGEHWVHLEKYVNKNGEFAISNLDYDIVDIIDDLELVHLENGFSVLKSLAGIENNNGWTLIWGKKLPFTDIACHFIVGGKVYTGKFIFKTRNFKSHYGKTFSINTVTHYQPIIKPSKLPIY